MRHRQARETHLSTEGNRKSEFSIVSKQIVYDYVRKIVSHGGHGWTAVGWTTKAL